MGVETSPRSLHLEPEIISEILDFSGNYRDDAEKASCQRMVEDLSPEEQEIAARTSYTYWFVVTLRGGCPSEEIRLRAAMKEARRHFVGETGHYENALASLRDTCRFRKERKIDLLRLCFTENGTDAVDNDDDKKLLSRWETLLQEEIERQASWVGGYDREHRAIFHRRSRNSADFDDESYNLLTWFLAERAFACTEVFSKGRQESIVIVLDYSNYQSQFVPPMPMIKESLKTLQRVYPERAKKVFVLDPPFWLKIAFLLVTPFLASETREKICVVAGNNQRVKKIGALVDKEQASPAMLPDGQMELETDVRELLRNPFHAQCVSQ